MADTSGAARQAHISERSGLQGLACATDRPLSGAFGVNGETDMKRTTAIVLSVCGAASALAETNVGVSIGINQPRVYGSHGP
jgi:hypothetical protein